MLQPALAAGETLDATVVNMRFVKPLDIELMTLLASQHSAFVTVEENVIAGGAGSAVSEALAATGVTMPALHLGLPDRFPDHGDPAVILHECGLDAEGIVDAIERRFAAPQLNTVAKPAA
jgi:1-deoxy-D-xylulose-5-phosphate synthase